MSDPHTTTAPADQVPDDTPPPAPTAGAEPDRPSAPRRFAARLGAGVGNTAAALRHRLATGNQSDDEIRRRIVMRQLGAYEARRETAREELDQVRKKIVRLERIGVGEGWTPEQRQQMRMLREDRKWREAASVDMLRDPFQGVQPTGDQIRRHRHLGSARRTVVLLVLLGALVAGLVQAPRFGVLLAVLALVVVWWMGGHPPTLTYRPVPQELLARPELAPPPAQELAAVLAAEAEDGDTDLRGVDDPDGVAQRIRWALARRRLQVREVHSTARTPWGWQSTIVLRTGTSADVVRALPDLVTDFRVGTSRIMAAANNPDDGAEVTLRILMRDPFASPPPFPVRAPGSCSINDPFSPFISLDGEPTELVLPGTNVLVVANPGGGKSGLTLSIADFASACRDAVVWDIDPTGGGLGPLGAAADHRAMTPEAAEESLARLVEYARTRTRIIGEDAARYWEVTEQAPAIVAIVDEYLQLSDEAKKHAIDLLWLGRKARIILVICVQDATKEALSKAIADTFSIRVMLPCRADDVPIVVGSRTAVSEGWLPHMLTPGDHLDPADAGQCYVWSPRHKTPILRYTIPLEGTAALARATERAAAGLPRLDDATTGHTADPEPAPFVAKLLAFFAAEGDPAYLTVKQILDHLIADDPARWARWDDRKDRMTQVGKAIRAELQAADCPAVAVRTSELPGRPAVYLLADLKAPTTAPD